MAAIHGHFDIIIYANRHKSFDILTLICRKAWQVKETRRGLKKFDENSGELLINFIDKFEDYCRSNLKTNNKSDWIDELENYLNGDTLEIFKSTLLIVFQTRFTKQIRDRKNFKKRMIKK